MRQRERFTAAIIFGVLIAAGAPAQSVASAAPPPLKGAASSRTLLWAYAYGPSGYYEFGPVKALDETYDADGRVVSWTLSYIDGTAESRAESGARAYDDSGGYVETVRGPDGSLRRTVAALPGRSGWSTVACRPDGSVIYAIAPVTATKSSFEYLVTGSLGEPAFRGAESFTTAGLPAGFYRFGDDGGLAYATALEYAAFDDRGNWTVRKESERYLERWDRPKSKAVRTIAYAGAAK